MKTGNYFLSPSILAADFGNLQAEIEQLNNSLADWIHVDVMDGVYVPNISFGFPVMEVLNKHASKPLDVHLMIDTPDRYLERFAAAGASSITVHLEACVHLDRTIQAIRELGCKAAVALNPATPVGLLEEVLAEIDMVLIMSVNPGFGGQKFIPNALKKIRQLRQMAQEVNDHLLIQVDGGVNLLNANSLLEAGADSLVVGSAIFHQENVPETIKAFKSIQTSHSI